MAESAALRERIRRIHAELRVLKGEAKDPALRRKLAALAEDVTGGARPAQRHERTALSPRERDILALVAEGLSYRYVGERLGLAQQTVKSYMRDIIARLGVHSRHEAVVEARRQGILP
jgi:DNA-binding NarL/FixJ family response regulator